MRVVIEHVFAILKKLKLLVKNIEIEEKNLH